MTDKKLDLSVEKKIPATGVITEERLVDALNEGLLDNLSAYECKGINHDQLVEVLGRTGDDYTLIEDFLGGIEQPISVLNNLVPDYFPNNKKQKTTEEEYQEEECTIDDEGVETCKMVTKTRLVPEVDENGDPIMIKKMFKEYSYNYRVSLDGTKFAMHIGYTDENGNLKHKVSDAELRAWVRKFTVDNILVHKDWDALLNSSAYKEENEI